MSSKRISILGDGKMSPNFSAAEVRAKSTGDLHDMDSNVFRLAELVRKYAGGTPVKINSAIRNFVPSGGVQDSAHMRGNALDIGLNPEQMRIFRANTTQFFNDADGVLGGFGTYTWGVHVDTEFAKVANIWTDGGHNYALRYWDKSGNPVMYLVGPYYPDHSTSELNSDLENSSDNSGIYFVVAAVLAILFFSRN